MDKKELDKFILKLKIVFGILSALILFAIVLVGTHIATTLGWCLIAVGSILFILAMYSCLRIETHIGFHECNFCKHKHNPKFEKVFWTPYIGRTRYMKCPECGEYGWHKKVLE